MDKLSEVRDRCYECNVVLKFSKSTFGFIYVKFFGYKVQDSKWCLDDDLEQAVTVTLMPTDLKKERKKERRKKEKKEKRNLSKKRKRHTKTTH